MPYCILFMVFSDKILLWYAANKRPLPWRGTLDPYKIWLSEIILQQTRVAQGISYYLKFVAHFPSVQDLANSNEETVLKLWQGLGYYSRARNLHATAKMVVQYHGGLFPRTYKELLKLKGIGDYTASAIASICFNEARPVVDGNVYRVLARYFGIAIPINSSEGVTYFKLLAQEIMCKEHIRDYNQAIMEFGALQCVPKNPDCGVCPIHMGCKALQEKTVGQLPIKSNKTKIRQRFFNYLVFLVRAKGAPPRTLLKQRRGKGIWQNLYEFPLLETETIVPLSVIQEHLSEQLPISQTCSIYVYNIDPVVHKLSHQHLYTRFWIVTTCQDLPDTVAFTDIPKYPVPVLIADFINTFKI